MARGLRTHDQSLEGGGNQDTIRSGAWMSCHLGVGLQVGQRRRCEVQGPSQLPTLYTKIPRAYWDHHPVTAAENTALWSSSRQTHTALFLCTTHSPHVLSSKQNNCHLHHIGCACLPESIMWTLFTSSQRRNLPSTCTHTPIHTCTHMCTHTHTYICTHTHAHIPIHTHQRK